MSLVELLSTVNDWIAKHQALVVTVGIPLLTAMSAAIVSFTTTRANLLAQKRQRQLEIQIQLCQFRQEWINDLRNDLAEVAGLARRFDNKVDDQELHSRLVVLISKIRMRINPEDPDDDALANSFAVALGENDESEDEVSEEQENKEEPEYIPTVGQRILKREWERLKADLHQIEAKTP